MMPRKVIDFSPGETRKPPKQQVCFCGSEELWISCSCGGFVLGPGMSYSKVTHTWSWYEATIINIRPKLVKRILVVKRRPPVIIIDI